MTDLEWLNYFMRANGLTMAEVSEVLREYVKNREAKVPENRAERFVDVSEFEGYFNIDATGEI